MRIKNIALAGAMALAFGNAQATLFDRGGGLIYDSSLNITWLAHANYYTVTEGGEAGAITWSSAMVWADGLTYGGFNDWRLPTTLIPDPSCSGGFGHNCTGSEMGHLFYEVLGGVAGTSILVEHNDNFSLFSNFQHGNYWSGTEFQSNNMIAAWVFGFGSGFQHAGGKGDNLLYALAGRDGVVAAPIPEPETYAMMLAGLGLLGVFARRRKQKLNA